MTKPKTKTRRRKATAPSKEQLRNELDNLRLHYGNLSSNRNDEADQYSRRLLHLETVIAKCARQFRVYADTARQELAEGDRSSETMDVFVHNGAMASMCEEALRT